MALGVDEIAEILEAQVVELLSNLDRLLVRSHHDDQTPGVLGGGLDQHGQLLLAGRAPRRVEADDGPRLRARFPQLRAHAVIAHERRVREHGRELEVVQELRRAQGSRW
jgi:hypothetical protein